MCEKYPNVSQYAYCGNNPVRYVDPDGKRLVDSNGKIMYQNGKWLNNSGEGARLIGNNMCLTSTGREFFSNLVSADYNVQLVYDKITTEVDGRPKIGEARISYDSKGEVTSAKITVFEINLKGELDNLTEIKNRGLTVLSATDNQITMLREGIPTVNERIGQVGVHEAEHVLNPAARPISGGDYEGVALRAESKAIRETYMLKPLPIPEIKVPQQQILYP